MQNRFQNTLKNEIWTSKLDVKIDPKWGVWGIIWGVGVVMLDQFWRSGRVVAPKRVLRGVLGGPWVILGAKMAPT